MPGTSMFRCHLPITPPKHFPNLTLWEAPPLGGTGFFWRVFWSGVFWRIFGHFFQSDQKTPDSSLDPVFWSVINYILTAL